MLFIKHPPTCWNYSASSWMIWRYAYAKAPFFYGIRAICIVLSALRSVIYEPTDILAKVRIQVSVGVESVTSPKITIKVTFICNEDVIINVHHCTAVILSLWQDSLLIECEDVISDNVVESVVKMSTAVIKVMSNIVLYNNVMTFEINIKTPGAVIMTASVVDVIWITTPFRALVTMM